MARSAACLLVLLSVGACGGGGGHHRQSCEASGDCDGGVCFQQACYTACAKPADCGDDEVCVHRSSAGDQADVCVTAAEFEGCVEGACVPVSSLEDIEGADTREIVEPPADAPSEDATPPVDATREADAAELRDALPETDAIAPTTCAPACTPPAACFDGVCQADPQVAPHFVGTYRVQSDLDIADGAPAAFTTVLQRMIATLVDPSTALLLRSCDLAGTAAADLCQLAFVDPSTPDAAALTPLGQAIQAHVQAWLSVQVPEWQPGGIPGLKASLDEAFGAVRLGATFGMGSDPQADGTIATSGASWDKASMRFPFRVACDLADDACGRLEVDLIELGSGKLGQAVGSKAVLEPAGWTLDVQAHTFTLYVGKIVAWLFWGNVLPELYGNGADGQPYVDSWMKLVRASLAGQRACLDAGTCCELFANAIAAVDETAAVSLLLDACEVLALEEPQNELVNADLTQNNLTLTTDPAVPCRLYDLDADGITDAWGLAAPPAKRCAWWFFWSAGTAVSVPNTFWATSDVATP